MEKFKIASPGIAGGINFVGSLRAAHVHRYQNQSSRAHRTLKQVKRAVQVLTGLGPAFRRLNVYPDDVFIVSYPRSGNTWLRFLVGNLLYADPTTFANVESRVPDIYKTRMKTLISMRHPRYLKSHECFDPQYPKVIYVVRDPRDVLISYYHWQIRRRRIEDDYPIEEFANLFMERKFDKYGTWQDHVASWICARGDSDHFLVIRYEDLLTNTIDEVKRIATFIRTNASDTALKRAIELSSFSSMRQLEKTTSSRQWTGARGARRDVNFVRAGTSEQWKEVCPYEVVREIERRWHTWMERFGYPLETHP